MWSRPGIGKLLVFIAPLLDESTTNRTHHAQEEAEEQHDIDANGVRCGTICGVLTIVGEEHPVYLDDRCCDDGREQSVLQGDHKGRNVSAKSAMFVASHQENH